MRISIAWMVAILFAGVGLFFGFGADMNFFNLLGMIMIAVSSAYLFFVWPFRS